MINWNRNSKKIFINQQCGDNLAITLNLWERNQLSQLYLKCELLMWSVSFRLRCMCALNLRRNIFGWLERLTNSAWIRLSHKKIRRRRGACLKIRCGGGWGVYAPPPAIWDPPPLTSDPTSNIRSTSFYVEILYIPCRNVSLYNAVNIQVTVTRTWFFSLIRFVYFLCYYFTSLFILCISNCSFCF